jgi:hypothetical protein
VTVIADCLILTPTRSRPRNAERLLDAVHSTAKGRTHVALGVDQDDPELAAYHDLKRRVMLPGDHLITSDRRRGLAAWTNILARALGGGYRFLGSLGDDMVPVTPGWDVKLMDACGKHGMAYPWSGVRDDIPEAIIMTADIPEALGWMMLPAVTHYYGDNAWMDIGQGAGCIKQLRGVIIEHRNAVSPWRADADPTYRENAENITRDKAAYDKWRLTGMQDAIKTVREIGPAGMNGDSA